MDSRRPLYCLDTGPLLDVLLVRFGKKSSKDHLVSAAAKHLNSPYSVEGFETFLASSLALLTTLGVLVEIDRHVQAAGFKTDRLRRFRAFCRDQLALLKVEVCSAPYFELDRELYEECGPTDASIAFVANARQATIVGVDQKLRNACLRRSIRFKDIHEVVAEFGGPA